MCVLVCNVVVMSHIATSTCVVRAHTKQFTMRICSVAYVHEQKKAKPKDDNEALPPINATEAEV